MLKLKSSLFGMLLAYLSNLLVSKYPANVTAFARIQKFKDPSFAFLQLIVKKTEQ